MKVGDKVFYYEKMKVDGKEIDWDMTIFFPNGIAITSMHDIGVITDTNDLCLREVNFGNAEHQFKSWFNTDKLRLVPEEYFKARGEQHEAEVQEVCKQTMDLLFLLMANNDPNERRDIFYKIEEKVEELDNVTM